MIHSGHNCDPVEPVVVSVHGADTPEGHAFVTALRKALDYSYRVRTLENHTGVHALGECPDIVFESPAPVEGRHPALQILLGTDRAAPVDVGADADITVVDPLHPDAPLRTAEAMASLPTLAAIGGLGTPLPAPGLQHVELLDYPDPEAVFQELYGQSGHRVWLDSSNRAAADAVEGRNRFSIMADDSGRHGMRAHHENGVTTVESNLIVTRVRGPFFAWLDRIWGRTRAARTPELPPGLGFALGWLGYLGYELKRECGGNTVQSSLPDASLIRCSRAVVFDHQTRRIYLLTESGREGQRWCEDAARRIQRLPHVPAPLTSGLPSVQFSAADSGESYLQKITASQEEIRRGNSYEVCLTTQLSSDAHASLDPWEFYRKLRRASPAPFASYIQLGPVTIASSSPERFLSITADGRVRAEPIKGTRRRDPSPTVDRHLKHDLMTSVKDRAENIMIVDLMRNDLSRHALPGTVSVTRLCELETYATVHQLVSTVEATIAPGRSRAAVVAAAYPPGSMTGAPKISSMDILDRLESEPRGPYSGVVGYFSPNGAADLSVTIRSAVFHKSAAGVQRLSVGIGGAITADSHPEEELAEIHTKARAILGVLRTGFPS
ncbi:aminodeoxychorismate synthase component I [Arthrobacter sp.]|uniref:aminodeoxychorismate synthase component I n=1 Tax=Arthrobacter sp. TaxID=1667 RepID=UPI002811B8E5|nr:aminodeoxychorismate synthase component I [Arthrobacter sp.]